MINQWAGKRAVNKKSGSRVGRLPSGCVVSSLVGHSARMRKGWQAGKRSRPKTGACGKLNKPTCTYVDAPLLCFRRSGAKHARGSPSGQRGLSLACFYLSLGPAHYVAAPAGAEGRSGSLALLHCTRLLEPRMPPHHIAVVGFPALRGADLHPGFCGANDGDVQEGTSARGVSGQ